LCGAQIYSLCGAQICSCAELRFAVCAELSSTVCAELRSAVVRSSDLQFVRSSDLQFLFCRILGYMPPHMNGPSSLSQFVSSDHAWHHYSGGSLHALTWIASLSLGCAYIVLLHNIMQGHPNNIVLEATRPKKRRKLSKIEWLSLLAVNVEGRSVSKQQRNHLQQALESDDAQNCVRPLQVQPPHYPCSYLSTGPATFRLR
jgi:hypothetical protein